MYEDAVNYMRAEEAIIDTIETKILKMPNRAARIEFNTSGFIGTEDLLGELRKKIPQKHEVVNTKELAESAGMTDCDIDMDIGVSYTPVDEKIKLVTAESGVYEAQLKIDKDYDAQALSLYMLRPLSGALGILRHGLTERRFFGKADDEELLNYLEGHKSKRNDDYSLLFNRIIDTAKEKLKLPSAPQGGYDPVVK